MNWKSLAAEQVVDVVDAAGDQVVHADHLVALGQQPFTEMGTEKTRTASDKGPLAFNHHSSISRIKYRPSVAFTTYTVPTISGVASIDLAPMVNARRIRSTVLSVSTSRSPRRRLASGWPTSNQTSPRLAWMINPAPCASGSSTRLLPAVPLRLQPPRGRLVRSPTRSRLIRPSPPPRGWAVPGASGPDLAVRHHHSLPGSHGRTVRDGMLKR